MSERADDDVRGEQRKAARQLKQQQQQLQRGEASTAMATGAERRSLPSPEIMLGQPWSSWVDAVKLHGSDDSEESLKECGKNREAMRLCRDDMPIFGQCPAQDDFYLVMCSHCSQVVKPQAFQAHYERRHSSSSKPSSSLAPSAAYAMSTPPHRSRGSGGGGVSGGVAGRPSVGNSTSSSSSSSSSNSKTNKSAKEFSGHGRPPFFPKVQDKILTPAAVKVEKVDSWKVKAEPPAKMGHAPASSSSTVSSPMKPGLSCPSIPKPPMLAPGQIPNGKGHLSLPDKKQANNSASSKRPQYKRPLQEREFNPDIHCGVVDLPARKPCTRSLTCKTHSLSQRRAVPGRGKRFDTLLAEHKSNAREKELQHRSDLPLQTPPLRDPHPPPSSRLLQDPHQVSHGNGTADATKPSLLSKPKPHNPGLPRLNSSNSHSGGLVQGDLGSVHEPPHHPAAAIDGQTRLSSDEGEAEEREDAQDKLDCHYSGYHPRPAAYCTFGSRLYGRSCHSFDRRWDRVRCAFNVMMDKHVNSQMWKKIPLALENSSAHRTSTNSLSSSASAAPRSVSPSHSGFRSPSPAPPAPPPPAYGQSHDSGSSGGKPALSYGTTLSARTAAAGAQGSAEHPAYGTQSRQVSSSPQMPSPHHPSPVSGRSLKQPRTSGSSKSSFRPKESPSAGLAHSTNTNTASSTNSSSSGGSISLGKKRKNSSLLMSYTTEASPSSSSSSSSSSTSPFKRNCVVGSSGSSGSSFHASPASSNPSSATTSSSSSHTGVYTVGLNCTPGRTSGLSLRHEPSARGPPSASPAESIKRMSVVMNSSDSTLSLGPFVHQGGDSGGGGQQQQQQHGAFGHPDARLEGKKRKGSPATGPINSSSGGLSGGQGPGRPKVTKSPSVNNIHSKHARTIPGTPGLSNNSLIHQPKARP